MSKRHTTDSDLEMYVLGALPPRRRAEVEQHVQGCTQCGARLAREARLEVALWELGRTMQAARNEVEAPVLSLEAVRQRRMGALARGWGRGMAALTAMGVAAAALLMVRGPKTSLELEPRLRSVPPGGAPERVAEPTPRLRPWACPDDPTGLRECQAAARRQGLYLPVASQPDEFFGYRTLAGGDGLGVSGPGKNWRTLVHRPWRGRD